LVKNDDDVCENFVSLRCKVKDENLFEQKKFLPKKSFVKNILISQ